MKLLLLALAFITVSASDTIYIYVNSIDHPKTTFVKRGAGTTVVTNGVACNGSTTLPGHDDSLYGTFVPVKNQWNFNGQHDNEIAMGYVRVGQQYCLSLTKNSPLRLDKCPSLDDEIKVGNTFAWFHDKRNSAIWAYGGDQDAVENNGLNFPATHLQTTGQDLVGQTLGSALDNTFLGLGHVNLGHTGKSPKGCQ